MAEDSYQVQRRQVSGSKQGSFFFCEVCSDPSNQEQKIIYEQAPIWCDETNQDHGDDFSMLVDLTHPNRLNNHELCEYMDQHENRSVYFVRYEKFPHYGVAIFDHAKCGASAFNYLFSKYLRIPVAKLVDLDQITWWEKCLSVAMYGLVNIPKVWLSLPTVEKHKEDPQEGTVVPNSLKFSPWSFCSKKHVVKEFWHSNEPVSFRTLFIWNIMNDVMKALDVECVNFYLTVGFHQTNKDNPNTVGLIRLHIDRDMSLLQLEQSIKQNYYQAISTSCINSWSKHLSKEIRCGMGTAIRKSVDVVFTMFYNPHQTVGFPLGIRAVYPRIAEYPVYINTFSYGDTITASVLPMTKKFDGNKMSTIWKQTPFGSWSLEE